MSDELAELLKTAVFVVAMVIVGTSKLGKPTPPPKHSNNKITSIWQRPSPKMTIFIIVALIAVSIFNR